MNARVAAVTATYRRPEEITRLLRALSGIPEGLEVTVIVDNGAGTEIRDASEGAGIKTHYVAPGTNLGCGAGLKLAAEEALQLPGPPVTHLWILDDDAVPKPDTLANLLRAMETENADAAIPLVTAPDGMVGWVPGLRNRQAHRQAELRATPAEFRERLGSVPLDFTWAQGISLLVTRRAIDKVGVHRDDFWIRGEDLEFSLRLTASFRGILVPAVEVAHLPPPGNSTTSRAAEYLKHAALVQNVAYIGARLPHGHRIASTIPANVARFIVEWGPRSIADACRAVGRGAIQGEPAGFARGTGETFRERFARL